MRLLIDTNELIDGVNFGVKMLKDVDNPDNSIIALTNLKGTINLVFLSETLVAKYPLSSAQFIGSDSGFEPYDFDNPSIDNSVCAFENVKKLVSLLKKLSKSIQIEFQYNRVNRLSGVSLIDGKSKYSVAFTNSSKIIPLMELLLVMEEKGYQHKIENLTISELNEASNTINLLSKILDNSVARPEFNQVVLRQQDDALYAYSISNITGRMIVVKLSDNLVLDKGIIVALTKGISQCLVNVMGLFEQSNTITIEMTDSQNDNTKDYIDRIRVYDNNGIEVSFQGVTQYVVPFDAVDMLISALFSSVTCSFDFKTKDIIDSVNKAELVTVDANDAVVKFSYKDDFIIEGMSLKKKEFVSKDVIVYTDCVKQDDDSPQLLINSKNLMPLLKLADSKVTLIMDYNQSTDKTTKMGILSDNVKSVIMPVLV